MSLTAHVEADAAEAMLGTLLDAVDDPSDMLRFLGDRIADYEQQVFATRGFGQWAALDLSTTRAKGSSRVLVDTGGLLHALTRSVGGNTRVEGDSVTLHSSEVSALFAQRGARGMPVRNPAPAPPPATVRGWADDLLGVLTSGGFR